MQRLVCVVLFAAMAGSAFGQWRVVSDHDSRQQFPGTFAGDGKQIKVGDAWSRDQRFRWLVANLEIPNSIAGRQTAGKTVGLQFSCGDGGEIYVVGQLQGRYDNDHPLLAVLTDKATPGEKVQVAVQVYGTVQGAGKFDEATMVILPDDRVIPVTIAVDATSNSDPVPDGLIGLSQGGGMADYEDATAAKLNQGGFKWFRTDNVLTTALKKDAHGEFVYDWGDFDKRVDFIHKVGADPILAVSYMPQVLDAVPNNDRQSAPAITRFGKGFATRRPNIAWSADCGCPTGKCGTKPMPAGSSRAHRTRAAKSSQSSTTRRSARSSPITKSSGASRHTPNYTGRLPRACDGPIRGQKLADRPLPADLLRAVNTVTASTVKASLAV